SIAPYAAKNSLRRRLRGTPTSRSWLEMGKRTKNAVQILDRMIGRDAELRGMVDEESLHAAIARMVYDARTKAGLTQADLARRVGTRQPAIARIEDADYRGHSLGLLSRIARAL